MSSDTRTEPTISFSDAPSKVPPICHTLGAVLLSVKGHFSTAVETELKAFTFLPKVKHIKRSRGAKKKIFFDFSLRCVFRLLFP